MHSLRRGRQALVMATIEKKLICWCFVVVSGCERHVLVCVCMYIH